MLAMLLIWLVLGNVIDIVVGLRFTHNIYMK